MKRSYLKRKTALKARGTSEASVLKEEIQTLLRQIVIARDKGCILQNIRPYHTRVLQADHLITRANSATYADSRLVVCLCRSCHSWKRWNKEQYDDLVKKILPKKIVKLWSECLKDSWKPKRTGTQYWKLD